MTERVTKRISGRTVGAAAAAMVLVLTLGACSGDKQSGKPGGARGRYIDQVDPICQDLRSAVGKLGDDPVKQHTLVNDALQRVKAIPRPSANRDELKLYLSEFQNMTIDLDDVAQSRDVNDQARVDAAQARAREAARLAAKAAKSYGFQECSQPIFS